MVRKMLAEMQPFRKIVQRSRETVVKSTFCCLRSNPLSRETVVKSTSCRCPMNPFVRSCVSIARNCSKIDILPVPDEPFREIVRVDCAKL